jgi:hypothetical protein
MCMVCTPIRLRSPKNETSRKKRFECYRQHWLFRLIHCRDYRSSRASQFQALRAERGLRQHSRYFWSSEGSPVYKHQKLTLQRALCSCGPTSVAA